GRGLARTRGAEQRHELARLDRERDVVDGGHGEAVVLRDVLEMDAGAARRGRGGGGAVGAHGRRGGHGFSYRRFGRRASIGMSSSRVTVTTTRLEAAAIVGSTSTVTAVYICTGRVWKVGERRNSAMTTSSSEVTKANTAPVATPRPMSGRVTRRKVRTGEAPRDADARSSLVSNPPRALVTETSTNGTPIAAWANT